MTAAVTAASATPARILGRGSVVGALRAGLRTDLLLVTDQLAPLPVMAAGQWQEGAR